MRKKIYLGAHREKIDLGVFRISSCPNPPPYPLSAGVASTSARGEAPAQEMAKSSPSAASTQKDASYQSSPGSASGSRQSCTPDSQSEVGNQGLGGLGLTWESF